MLYKSTREIIGLLTKHRINEFEHEEAGRKIRIKCGYKPINARETKKQTDNTEEAKAKKKLAEKAQIYVLKSKNIGYFHVFKKREDGEEERIELFVEVGQEVGLENILGVIECLNMHHEIRLADYHSFKGSSAIIEKILVEEAMPVDYGRLLFSIKPVYKPEDDNSKEPAVQT